MTTAVLNFVCSRTRPPSCSLKALAKAIAVAFHHYVQIQILAPQQNVPYEASHRIGFETEFLGQFAGIFEKLKVVFGVNVR